MKNDGIIFDISRFCQSDGPGIRTTIFLKGCPLNCIWCHNPESQHIKPEIMYSKKACIHCAKCVDVCKNRCHTIKDTHVFNRTLCDECGECVKVCPSKALEYVGRYCSAEEIIAEAVKDKVYYEESGGGITVSGGEPMMQIDFLETLLTLAKKEKLHTCIETCGYAKKCDFEKIAPLVDCFLYDFKESNNEKHCLFTGVDNHLILENLALLNSIGSMIILRVPLIPGYNDTYEHMKGIAAVVNKHKCIKKIEIMPYHALGVSKAEAIGRNNIESVIPVPDNVFLKQYTSELAEKVSVEIEVMF